ncbi:MAG TPA: hypothetical protein VD788_11425 [Candidatus Polarisedimenticolaceae bacterium]|nr:hypothetical protein [Candidatus Polarisedimenticolaceae bacterium]
MGKPSKFVLAGGVVVLIAAGIAVWLLLGNLDRIVKRAVERVGSETTGTRVALDDVLISIRSTEGALDGLTIANPPGYETTHALELERVRLALDLSSLRTDEVVLREVAVDGAHVVFEQKGQTSNLRTLLDHVERAGRESGDPRTAAGDELRLVVEKFTFSGGKVTLIHDRLDEDLTFEIPEVVVRDIGRVGAGETIEDVARQLLEPVLERTIDSAKDEVEQMVKQRLEQEVESRKQQALESLKDRLLDKD